MGIRALILSLFNLNLSPDSLTKKGNRLLKREKYMEAIEPFKKALTMNSLYIPAYDGLGRAYYKLGFKEEAEREFAIADGLENVYDEDTDIELILKMGRAFYSKGLHKYVLDYLEPLYKKYHNKVEFIKLLGLAQKATGNQKKAREYFQTGMQKWPKDPDFYQQMANLELKSGNKEVGEHYSEIASLMARIDAAPHDDNLRYAMARVYFQNKQYSEAADYLRQAINLRKDHFDYWLYLGECYKQTGQNPAAVDALKVAARLNPSDPRPQKLLSQVLRVMGRFEESRSIKQVATVLEGGQTEQQTPAQAAKFLRYLLSIGKLDEARKHFGEFKAKWPNSLDLLLLEGRLLIKDNKHKEAIEVLKQVAAKKDQWAEPHIWLALSYQKLGDTMSALAEGQLATRLAPKSPTIHKLYGDILREQKKFSMAENAYETAENLKSIKKGK